MENVQSMERFIAAYRRFGDFLSTNGYFKYLYLGAVILFIVLTVARRPDVITYPQFNAEEGAFWYAEAYDAHHFWEPFLVPKSGYFQTVCRVGGYLGNLVDIGQAPSVFSLMAILFQVLPAAFFLSRRFESIVPSFLTRLLCGVAYLLFVGSSETHANLTNSQWRLAVLMFLIVIVPQSRKIGWKLFDNGMLLLSGLSGPFVLFMLPAAIAYYRHGRKLRDRVDRLAMLSVAFVVQAYALFFIENGTDRSAAPLGAGLMLLLRILSRAVFLRPLIGPYYTGYVMGLWYWNDGFLPVVIGIAGIVLIGYAFRKSQAEMRLFIAFTFLVLFGALCAPQVSLERTQWEVMAGGGGGGRYWFLPGLAWVMSLGWLLFNARRKSVRNIAGALLLCMVCIGMPHDFSLPKYRDFQFQRQVSEFKALEVGQPYTFRIVPKWNMTLVRK